MLVDFTEIVDRFYFLYELSTRDETKFINEVLKQEQLLEKEIGNNHIDGFSNVNFNTFTYPFCLQLTSLLIPMKDRMTPLMSEAWAMLLTQVRGVKYRSDWKD